MKTAISVMAALVIVPATMMACWIVGLCVYGSCR